MNWLELVAASLGIINVVLLVRRSIWNYPFGLAMVAVYAPVFYAARLYSDALLQLFFFAVQLYGWWSWQRSEATAGTILVERLDGRGRVAWALTALVATLLWGGMMRHLTDAAHPLLDAANAMFSITAQLLLARRLVENWPVWVGVDALAIGLYLSRGLMLTAMLYALMLLLCLWGWRAWLIAGRRAGRRDGQGGGQAIAA